MAQREHEGHAYHCCESGDCLSSAGRQACGNFALVSLQAGVDYTHLRDLLAEGKFQDADDETRALLIKLAGPGAVDRKWVYFTEVGDQLYINWCHIILAPEKSNKSVCMCGSHCGAHCLSYKQHGCIAISYHLGSEMPFLSCSVLSFQALRLFLLATDC